jgi:hypothetical protein
MFCAVCMYVCVVGVGGEMAWFDGELDSDRLELPASSWWITCITILVAMSASWPLCFSRRMTAATAKISSAIFTIPQGTL